MGGPRHKNIWESCFKVPTAEIYQSILGPNPAKSSCHVSSFPLVQAFMDFSFFPSPAAKDSPSQHNNPLLKFHMVCALWRVHFPSTRYNNCRLSCVLLGSTLFCFFFISFTSRGHQPQPHLQLPHQAPERSCQHLTASRSYVGPQDVEQ